jgi:hypothetical protein
MSILNTLIKSFDPEGSLGVAVDSPEVLQSTPKTANLILGRRVPFQASFGENLLPGFVTLKSANLQRLSVEDHTSANGTKPLVSGIFNNVQMDVEVMIGTEIISLQELLLGMSNASSKTQATLEEFMPTLESLGFRFNSGMTFFWQQFGSNINTYNELRDAFKSLGAVSGLGTKNLPAKVKEVWEMPKNLTGPAVVGFEVSRAKREESKTQQGFLDFVDAVTANYKRIVNLRTTSAAMKHDITTNSVAQGWSPEKIKATNEHADALMRISQNWSSVWSGSSQGKITDPKDPSVVELQDQYYATKANCGRFSVVINGNIMPVDLWTNSLQANTSGNTTASVTAPAVADESPITWQ